MTFKKMLLIKQMLKMCFILVLSFVICWLPMQFITVYRFVDDSITNNNYFGDIFFVCKYYKNYFLVKKNKRKGIFKLINLYFLKNIKIGHSVAVSRSFLNPFIYSWTNAKFRQGFKYFLFFLWIGKKTASLNRFNMNESIHMNLKHRIDSTRSNTRAPTPAAPAAATVTTTESKKYSIRFRRNHDLKSLKSSQKEEQSLNSN